MKPLLIDVKLNSTSNELGSMDGKSLWKEIIADLYPQLTAANVYIYKEMGKGFVEQTFSHS